MSKPKMVFYAVLGSLVSVLIWSFIGGCHTSTGPSPETARAEAPVPEEVAPPAPISRETLVEEGIITGERTKPPAAPARVEAPVPPPAETAAAQSPAESAPERVHTVEQGDSLWGISRRYGVSADQIARANRLDDPGRLAVGQRLVIP